MSFQKNITQKLFWINVLKVSIPFLLAVTVFSLLFNSAGDILSGDFKAVNETHFSNKKWVRFWLSKIVISVIYAIYMVNKRMK